MRLGHRWSSIVLLLPSLAAAQGLPDLVVQSATVGEPVFRGESARIAVTVANDGPTDAVGFALAAELTVMTGLVRRAPLSLAAHTSTAVTLQLPIPPLHPLGAAQVMIIVDADAVVAESRETNNLLSRSVQIRERGPDLIGAFRITPVEGRPREPALVELTVTNTGTRAAGAHQVWVQLMPPRGTSPIFVGSVLVLGLPAGASTVERTTFTIPDVPTGRYTWALLVDALSDVAEADETNNVALGSTIRIGALRPEILTRTLTSGWVGRPYTDRLTASFADVRWSLATPLPAGLTLEPSSGVISGTPVVPAQVTLTVQATRSGETVEGPVSLTILPSALELDPAALPVAFVGLPYLFELTAHGGAPPYTFSVIGALPRGLGLDDRGVLSGAPATAGVSTIEVRVDDAQRNHAEATFVLTTQEAPEPLTIETTELPPGRVGEEYCSGGPVRLRARGGIPPLTWRTLDGTRPAGMVFGEDGTVCGQPRDSALHTVMVAVSDAEGSTDSQTVTLLVEPAPTPSPSPSMTAPPSPDLDTVEPSSCGCRTSGTTADPALFLFALAMLQWHRRRRAPTPIASN